MVGAPGAGNRIATLAMATCAALVFLLISGPVTALERKQEERVFPVYSTVLRPKREVWDGTEVVYQVPENPRAVMFLAHGCGSRATAFWDAHPDCAECSGLPENRAFVIQALQASYALIAISSPESCWRENDVPRVKRVLERWMSGLKHLPLLALGASSGGWLVSLLAPALKFDALVVMITDGSFQAGLPYPPVLFVYMVKDEARAARIRAMIPVLQADEIPCEEMPITDDFFTRRIPYVDLEMSVSLVGILERHGHLDLRRYLKSDPGSFNLKQEMSGEEVLKSLASKNEYWERHVQQELSVAYGFHQFTSLPTPKIVAWLESHVKMPLNMQKLGIRRLVVD